MNLLVFFNDVIKYILTILFTFYVIFKITNYKCTENHKNNIIIFSSILLGLIYALFINYLNYYIIILAILVSSSLISSYVMEKNIDYTFTLSIISLTFTYIINTFSIIIVSLLIHLPHLEISNENPIIRLLINVLSFFLLFCFFKINRFKKGFAFLKDEEKFNTISIIGILLCGFSLIFYSITRYSDNLKVIQFLLLSIILIAFGIFIWIKRNLKISYKEKMKDQTIEILKKELEDENLKNLELKKEIENLSLINHKYSSRIKATEQNISKLAYAYTQIDNHELTVDISEINNTIKQISNEYSNEIRNLLKYAKQLPKTNIQGIDNMLEHMQTESIKSNINFDLKINCSINNMIENYISQNMLETLLGDHLKDAIIAINSNTTKNINKDIYIIFEITNNYYELSIYDSGVSFDIDTLVNLGIKQITTHKETGGSGIGFMTTFNTLKHCNASIIIEEIDFKNSNFSKAIKFRFNGKNDYIIHSSRWKEIKSKDYLNRIIFEDYK